MITSGGKPYVHAYTETNRPGFCLRAPSGRATRRGAEVFGPTSATAGSSHFDGPLSHETRHSLENDGYRVQLAVHADRRVLLRSRQDTTDMTGSFPEIRTVALTQLPAGTGLDGELVVWEKGRLAFERLQQRLARRGTGAAEAARQWPVHYVAFALVHQGDTDLTSSPYERRRTALEALFADHRLEAPLTLCPSTTDPAVARGWLEWTAAGLKGLCFKQRVHP
ncbi:hypothetical protein ABZ473_32075 [Streptomyces cellulosae]